MNSFIYDIPTKVYFGEHQLSHLGEELAKYGKRVLLTYGGGSIKKSGLYDAVAAEVKAAALQKGTHRRAAGGRRRLHHRRDEVHRRRGLRGF